MSASIGFAKRLRLSATFGFVSVTRVTIDGVNHVFGYIAGPFRRKWNQVVGDAPWVIVLAISMSIQFLPTIAVPSMQPWVSPDTRRMLEQERIRSEVQQGRDPHPYLLHRDLTYGATGSNQETNVTNVPRDSVPECDAIDRFRELRKKQYDHEKVAIDAKIAELERAAQADAVTKWIRSGISS